MSYHLVPRNKDLEIYYFGAFSFTWMLDAGVGLVLGTGKSIEPASFRYVPDKKGRCPRDNDGFYVTSKQAKIMSLLAYGLVSVERGKLNEWNKKPTEEQESIKKYNDKHHIYNLPIREDFIEKVEEFAEWVKKSGGFKIK
jgi:hypothetical protein